VVEDIVNTSLSKELVELKMKNAMLQSQLHSMQLYIDRLANSCHIANQPLYPYVRPPLPQLDDQGRSMEYPLYYNKWEDPAVSYENQPSLPTYRHDCQQHHPVEYGDGSKYYQQVSPVEYGDGSKYYQQPCADAHSRHNGFYYHPYSRK
jgi:hypothetical protein